MPLGELKSREVFSLPDGVEKKVRFGGVKVLDSTTGQIVFLSGPVDLVRYHAIEFSGINPNTGLQWTRHGYGLLVTEEDGVPVERFWNLVARRAQEQLTGDLETGLFTQIRYSVLGVGAPPDTRYTIRRLAA